MSNYSYLFKFIVIGDTGFLLKTPKFHLKTQKRCWKILFGFTIH